MTDTNKEDEVALERVPYVHYLLCFWKDTTDVRVLIDSSSEVNAMTPAYASKLGLRARHTDIEAQKIDSSTRNSSG